MTDRDEVRSDIFALLSRPWAAADTDDARRLMRTCVTKLDVADTIEREMMLLLKAGNLRIVSLQVALGRLLEDAPEGLSCGDFHHPKADQHHGPGECPPMKRYEAALKEARAATNVPTLSDEGKALEVSDAAPDAVDAPQTREKP